jgi:hypothetical protein
MSSTGFRGGFASLGKGAKWFAGVVIVALVGALSTVVVRMLLPPAELSAKLGDVAIDRNVTLQEYAIRHAGGQHASLRRGAGAMLLVAAQTDGTGTTTDGTGTTTDGTGTTTDGTGTTTDGTGTTTDGTGTTTDGEGPVVGPQLDDEDVAKLGAGVEQALDAPDTRRITITPACLENASAPDCGLASVQLYMKVVEEDGSPANVSTATVEHRLARVFRGTRTQPSRADPGKRQLVGVTVNFDVTLTGFRGGTAVVLWSLYSGRTGVTVPDAWLRRQRALTLRGQADRESARGEFWVPVPQRSGPFFIRIGVYDDHGTRLDSEDTPVFR